MTAPKTLSSVYSEPELPAAWDWAIVGLTLISLFILFAEMATETGGRAGTALRWADNLICLLFVIDFTLRLIRSKQRREFIRRNWIDLLGAIPLVGPLHTFRVVRLVRILRFTRIAVLARRLMRRFDVSMPTETLGYLGIVAVICWLLAGSAFYGFESGNNETITGFDDALWWSMTTLSTVGYGDIYPSTGGGRMVALVTMVVGVGVLGTLAATIATAFIDLRERGRRGLRSFRMKGHLLVLGWNDKALAAIDDFRHDPRFRDTPIVVVADLETTPVDDASIRFVRGQPARAGVLERASAPTAAVAIVLANDPTDPRSDHETALNILALRALSMKVRISAELVDSGHRVFLTRAGCDSVVDTRQVASSLLVRSVQDVGVADVVEEILSNKHGSELYRISLPARYVGSEYRLLCAEMIDHQRSVIGISRAHNNLINPKADLVLEADDEVFVVAPEPELPSS